MTREGWQTCVGDVSKGLVKPEPQSAPPILEYYFHVFFKGEVTFATSVGRLVVVYFHWVGRSLYHIAPTVPHCFLFMKASFTV